MRGTALRPSGYRNRDNLNRVQQFDNLPNEGTGGATNLDGLTDVSIGALLNRQGLYYNSTSGLWENRLMEAADVPSLDASKITTGAFSIDRLAAGGSAGKILGYSGWLDFSVGEGWMGSIAKISANTTFTPSNNSSWFAITWPTDVRLSVAAMHPAADQSRFVADIDSVYHFAFMFDLTAAVNATHRIGIRKNGVTMLWQTPEYLQVDANYQGAGIMLSVELAAGEYLELVHQNTDAAAYGFGLAMKANSTVQFFRITTGSLVTGLDALTDVILTGAVTGHVLRYDGTNWVNVLGNLDYLTDVIIGSPTAGQYLTYNGTNWVNSTAGGGPTPTLDSLSNVSVAGKTTGSTLQWNGTTWAMKTYTMADFIVGAPTVGQVPMWNGTSYVPGSPVAIVTARVAQGMRTSNTPYSSAGLSDYLMNFETKTFGSTALFDPAGSQNRFKMDTTGTWVLEAIMTPLVFAGVGAGARIGIFVRANGVTQLGLLVTSDCDGNPAGKYHMPLKAIGIYSTALTTEYLEVVFRIWGTTGSVVIEMNGTATLTRIGD